MKKKIFTLLLAVAAGIGTMFAESGTCGENLTWDLTDGVLTISGTGAMKDYDYYSKSSPWYYKKSSITSVTIGTGVTSIGSYAFYECYGLTSVTIPNSVTYIGGSAFYECRGLTSVTIPNSVTYIGDGAFLYCTGLTYPVYNAHVFAYMPTSYSGVYTIPDGIESIAGFAFIDCSGLTSVTIPNSVTSIGNAAFYECYGLTSVTIPNSVTSIGDGAFDGCSGLTSVSIGNSVTSIGRDAFRYCYSLTIYVPCGTLDAYKNAEGWSDYASRIRYAPYSSYNINKKAENGHITTSSTDIFTMCDTEHPVICTATPDRGCYFVRWADGNTENPRTIELSQDTTMEAIFDYLLSGKCGKDSALTWTFEPASMALNITGKGALSENYTYGTFIESLTIGNEITSIGEWAFGECNNLKTVIIGSSVKVLEASAFANCSSIESITCYSQRPPTVNQNALYGLDYSTIVYVPADYLNTYKMHDAWGLYDVRPLGAKSTETTDVNVTPAENTAEVAWPAISGAATYELVIKDKSGNVICTLIFNANGQLTQIAFGAPARNNAPQQTQAAGFSFTVTGLENGTSYDLTITSKDNSGTTLDTKTISFTTSGEAPQGIDQVPSDQVQNTKILRDGQIFILRGDKIYTLQGQEVK
ncbi:MAG: leucine-rich repeat domain-containing protein [Paludibacteraceae bacterium]|nr:leucine-rich repeat domain-containing protein [Paludibacteraceae bacterium]